MKYPGRVKKKPIFLVMIILKTQMLKEMTQGRAKRKLIFSAMIILNIPMKRGMLPAAVKKKPIFSVMSTPNTAGVGFKEKNPKKMLILTKMKILIQKKLTAMIQMMTQVIMVTTENNSVVATNRKTPREFEYFGTINF